MTGPVKKYDFSNAYFKTSDYTNIANVTLGHLIEKAIDVHDGSEQCYEYTSMRDAAMMVGYSEAFDAETLQTQCTVTLMDEYGNTEVKTMTDSACNEIYVNYSRRRFAGIGTNFA